MTWVTASIIVFISSVSLYLLVRKGQLNSIPREHLNLGMFLIPTFLMAALTVIQGTSFILPWFHTVVIVLAGFFLSYLGNVSSLKSIETAPNPGYSLIISKSYVVYTSIAAIFLFGSELTLKNALSVLIIVLFSALITIDSNGSKKKSSKVWIVYTFGAFFAWGTLALGATWLLSEQIPVSVYLFYLMLTVSVCVLIEMRMRKTKLVTSRANILVLFGIGISASLFNFFMSVGFSLAPNPGYINAVNASSVSLLTLLSAYFYKDELNVKKVIGIIGVTVGLVVLFL